MVILIFLPVFINYTISVKVDEIVVLDFKLN